jgi:hypothetical protein
LLHRREAGQLEREDQTFLALLDIANTPPESFADDAGYERQKSRLEAAGLRITNDLFEFWQQNRDSSIELDKSAADATAGGELAAGINLHVRAKGRRRAGIHGYHWLESPTPLLGPGRGAVRVSQTQDVSCRVGRRLAVAPTPRVRHES